MRESGIMRKILSAIGLMLVLVTTPVFAANSPNGTIVRFGDPAGTSLTDNMGVWTFGTGPDGNGNYQVLLNGVQAGGGMAVLMEMDNGAVKVQAHDNSWWSYSTSVYWHASTAPPPAGVNTWIADNFAPYPVHTGTCTSHSVGYPSLVKDFSCSNSFEVLSVWECDDPNTGCPGAPYNDERIAVVNTTLTNGTVNGGYASGLYTAGDSHGWNNKMDVFMLGVTVSPYWPVFTDYTNTNFDGITFDGGWSNSPGWPDLSGVTGGHVYAKNVTIACPATPAVTCWSDAAFDVKPMTLMCVNCHTEGGGINTLKLWWPGPDTGKGWTGHYIVNSTINNSRYAVNPPVGTDGGLIWTWDCGKLVLNIYNSTFNGSPTLPLNMITCQVPGTPTIHYLTVDPTQTGEMHPMFR